MASGAALLRHARKRELSRNPDDARAALTTYWQLSRRKRPATLVAEGWNGLAAMLAEIEDGNSSLAFADVKSLGAGITRKTFNVRRCLLRAIAHDPHHSEALYTLGLLELKADKLQTAIALFERALERSRKGATAFYAAYYLAEALVSTGKQLRGAARAELDKRAFGAYLIASKAHLGFAAAHSVSKKLKKLRSK
jgi:hypothetical protein